MFSIGFYELIIICVLVLLIVPAKDLPRIARYIAKLIHRIREVYNKVRSDFDKISTNILEEDNFKTWEDRVEEKREEYNINLNGINNFINSKIETNTNKSKHDKK